MENFTKTRSMIANMRVLILLCMAACLLNFSSVLEAKSGYGALLCKAEGFSCLKIKKGQSWKSLWPDQQQRLLIMTINRMNTSLHPGMIIAVPLDYSKKSVMDFSPFNQANNTGGEKEIIFNPKTRAFAAYDQNGQLVKWGPASGGSGWCKDLKRPCHTAVGTFRIYGKGGPGCVSKKFPLPNGGAPMPYCMFFHGGDAFHGSPHEVPGYDASHGCVRLFVDDAKWLNQEFIELPNASNNYKGTKVIILPYPK